MAVWRGKGCLDLVNIKMAGKSQDFEIELGSTLVY